MTIEIAGVPGSQDDVSAIVRLVADIEHAQQNEQPDAFMRLFRSDAVWVTAHGKRLTGWEQINAFTQKVLPGAMRESTATYTPVHVLFIRPDVAAVNVRQRPVSLDGQPLHDQPQGSPLYILAKDDDGWRIAAAQNTIIIDPETPGAG
jgi:uncharacterized protein (TIGR02246 family)